MQIQFCFVQANRNRVKRSRNTGLSERHPLKRNTGWVMGSLTGVDCVVHRNDKGWRRIWKEMMHYSSKCNIAEATLLTLGRQVGEDAQN